MQQTDYANIRPSVAELWPFLGLAVASFGLWLFWPGESAAVEGGEIEVESPRYTICRVAGERPALIPLPSRSFSVVVRGETPAQDPLRSPKTRMARLLEWTPAETRVGSSAFLSTLSTQRIDGVRAYEPLSDEDLYFGSIASATGVVVGLSRNLSQLGFELAQATSNKLPLTEDRWVVEAHVDIDAKGHVERVFLLVPDHNEAVNDAVVRRLYEGHMGQTGKDCSGSVTVGWPGAKRGRAGK
jgi:hypothetical protein